VTLPPGVRRTVIETPRGTFAALEAVPGSGVLERGPALLVPGYTGSKEDFIAVLHPLARPGRRVVAIDMRGQHETAGPHDPAAYSLAALGADISALVDCLTAETGDPVHVVGHSFGGLVTREAVFADPSRIGSFTLMSSGPAALTGPSGDKAKALVEALGTLSMKQIWSLKLGPDAKARGLSDEVTEFLRARALGTSPLGLVAMGKELVSCPDRTDQLAKVAHDRRLPVLVLYGEDDDCWHPRLQAEMARRLDATKVVIPGAAHSPAVDAPETTASALTDFWNRAERRP
jgi:pimeloyl-ACP methyl ester carboxylesterase